LPCLLTVMAIRQPAASRRVSALPALQWWWWWGWRWWWWWGWWGWWREARPSRASGAGRAGAGERRCSLGVSEERFDRPAGQKGNRRGTGRAGRWAVGRRACVRACERVRGGWPRAVVVVVSGGGVVEAAAPCLQWSESMGMSCASTAATLHRHSIA
jgi:hypothetical protein